MCDKFVICVWFLFVFWFVQWFQNRLNKRYHQFWAETRSRKAFEENMELIKRHNALAKNGTYSFELRSNVMADFVSRCTIAEIHVWMIRKVKFDPNITYLQNFEFKLKYLEINCFCCFHFNWLATNKISLRSRTSETHKRNWSFQQKCKKNMRPLYIYNNYACIFIYM